MTVPHDESISARDGSNDFYTQDLIAMTRRVSPSCLRTACSRYHTRDLVLIIVVTGIVVLSLAGPHNVYTALFTTAHGSLASLLGVADSSFLTCTTAESKSSPWNRIDANKCKGTSKALLKATLQND